ncbi:MAG: hypothetical protein D3913_15435, partial [Candidatus Electrothrix sp. LOE1_4_5]|nr:hypothetical protein [Candidatus Electrothrix gigas]
FLTGLPFFPVTLLLMLIALSYSLFGGLRASVQTDLAQMILILVVILLMVPWVLLKSGFRRCHAGTGWYYWSVQQPLFP